MTNPAATTYPLPASEVGWFIDRRYWGQGLATEGAWKALPLAFGPVGLARVIARYNTANLASGRVMEKIGMQLWRELPHPELSGATVRIYERYARMNPLKRSRASMCV